MSHYSEKNDPDIPINACATLINIINYSIKICPEIEERVRVLIKSEIDMSFFQISFSIIKYLNFNLQTIQKHIESKMNVSIEDELCFKNMSRVSLLIIMKFKILNKNRSFT